ncbi:hypothetical protein MRX96_056758 [Rhipicephalus microplus]
MEMTVVDGSCLPSSGFFTFMKENGFLTDGPPEHLRHGIRADDAVSSDSPQLQNYYTKLVDDHALKRHRCCVFLPWGVLRNRFVTGSAEARCPHFEECLRMLQRFPPDSFRTIMLRLMETGVLLQNVLYRRVRSRLGFYC